MDAFPPLADRPDDEAIEMDLEDEEQISPIVLDMVAVIAERGLNLPEILELAQCCVASVAGELTQGEDSPETWMAVGRLQAAMEVIDSVEIVGEGEGEE